MNGHDTDQFYLVDEDECARIYRACPFCGRRLLWRYDRHRDFTIGTPRCSTHGDLDTWAITDGTQLFGAGQLTAPGIMCEDPIPFETVAFDSHRFKAVSPKTTQREPGALLDLMRRDDEPVN
jgi:endogenous inhibitor of DNA gyrase (YacG/DUF329 family)